MKGLKYIVVFIVMASCSTKDAWNCLQLEGNIIQKEFATTAFENIVVNRDIELVVEQGLDYKVIVETGENLMNDIEVSVLNDRLQLSDRNTCNLVRPYGITKVYVTAPNLKEIRNSSQHEVSSEGTLNFDSLRLISEDFNEPGNFTVGDFRMDLNTNSVAIVSNNISSFYLSGQTEILSIGFFSGAGRFEGETLTAQHVDVYHRGSNDMIVNPQLSLTGELRGTGNLIAVHTPQEVDVVQYYTGTLIFEN